MVFPIGDSDKPRIVPIATYTLIALNVFAYMVQLRHGAAFTAAYAATPWEIVHRTDIQGPLPLSLPETGEFTPGSSDAEPRGVVPQGPVPFPIWLTLLTALFLHESPLHLVGNMLFLWIFGDNVEEVLGRGRYVALYLCAGIAGSALMIAADPDSVVPTLGASGAIAGVMGAYIIWFPYHRVRVFAVRRVVEVPALVVIGLWILVQLAQGLFSISHLGEAGGVAYLAHVGGAATGVAAGLLFRRRARTLGHPTFTSRVVSES
jgi:membrane associated rhomboid family serine protease